jgi:hypothetical protein
LALTLLGISECGDFDPAALYQTRKRGVGVGSIRFDRINFP